MAHHTPFVNHEILKAKPREKDFTLSGGGGLFLLVKASVKKTLVLPLPALSRQ